MLSYDVKESKVVEIHELCNEKKMYSTFFVYTSNFPKRGDFTPDVSEGGQGVCHFFNAYFTLSPCAHLWVWKLGNIKPAVAPDMLASQKWMLKHMLLYDAKESKNTWMDEWYINTCLTKQKMYKSTF